MFCVLATLGSEESAGDVLGVVPCAPVEGKASSLRLVEGRVVGPALKLQVEGQQLHVCAEYFPRSGSWALVRWAC